MSPASSKINSELKNVEIMELGMDCKVCNVHGRSSVPI